MDTNSAVTKTTENDVESNQKDTHRHGTRKLSHSTVNRTSGGLYAMDLM